MTEDPHGMSKLSNKESATSVTAPATNATTKHTGSGVMATSSSNNAKQHALAAITYP